MLILSKNIIIRFFQFHLKILLKKNIENSAMDIYNFCNLEWDEKCLEFYKRDDLFTNTASINQIRTSVQKV